jgi:hypothetical protein
MENTVLSSLKELSETQTRVRIENNTLRLGVGKGKRSPDLGKRIGEHKQGFI